MIFIYNPLMKENNPLVENSKAFAVDKAEIKIKNFGKMFFGSRGSQKIIELCKEANYPSLNFIECVKIQMP